jgi:hypothetical protein
MITDKQGEPMNPDTQAPASWWGEYTIKGRQSLECRIGPLHLLIHNEAQEWQIAYDRDEENDDEHIVCNITESSLTLEGFSNSSRYILNDESGRLHIKPRLADRPVVSRPWSPFNLTAGENVTLYVSSPIWLEVAVGTKARPLEEIAIHRPSDTWFGSSTLEGELCYASRTSCRLRADELPWRPHRAITPLSIHNRADSLLALERISLPVPLLPLYASTDGWLWTPQVTLTREEDGDMAALKIDKQAPREIMGATLIDSPRKTAGHHTFIRAFNTLFS